MRVVLLSDRLPPEHRGGAETVVWMLARGLQEAGHQVHIIAGTSSADHKEMRGSVSVHLLHTAPPRWLQSWFTLYNPRPVSLLRRLLRQIKPDIVHAHNIHNHLSFGALAAAQQMGIATVFTAHDFMTFTYGKLTYGIDPQRCTVPTAEQFTLPPLHNLRLMHLRHNPLRTLLIRRILRRTHKRLAVSEVQRIALQANLKLNFEVNWNALPLPATAPSPAAIEALRSRWTLMGKRVILYSGRFTREKGSEQMLAAFDLLHASDPDVLLLLLTNSAVSPRDGVIIGGWLSGEELAAAYHVADVVVVPSVCVETFGMVALEAMAARKPVLASCFGGTAEVVRDGETGYVLNPYDTETFAARLAQVLGDPDLRQRMGESGYQRLLAHFSIQRQVEQVTHHYQRILENSVLSTTPAPA